MNIQFGKVKEIIIAEISKASNQLLTAVSWLTDKEIFDLLLQKLQNGVKVCIVTRYDYLNNHENALNWNTYIELGGNLHFCNSPNNLHYKFIVVDDSAVLITSHNLTCFAGENNRENVIILNDKVSITQYQTEFKELQILFTHSSNVVPYDRNNVPKALLGFYDTTIRDDLKNQKS
ncbi:MAG: phospholipase D family protein [Bacteroidota bacterium]|nr:phospholipase D family protein [Bacteroidota bacterium]